MKQALYTLSVAAVGFLAGWWLNDELSPVPPDNQAVTPLFDSAPIMPTMPPPVMKTPPRPTAVDFTRMLASGDIDSAMQVYDTLSADEPVRVTRLRAAVLDALEQKLAQGDGESLQLLADAWLSRYYDDIDVLLILAEFQHRMGYPDEAARVLQFAATYAHQPAQQEKVASYTRMLVQRTDAAFASENRWIELLGFYQLLESIELSKPEYRLGQARASLELGDYATAQELLEPLRDDTTLAHRATELLAKWDQPGTLSAARPSRGDGIALQRRGGHYLVPVRLNDEIGATLMIDTGASITSLTQARFDTLSSDSHFQYLGWRLFNTAGGTVRGTVYRASSLQVGEQFLREVDIAVLDYGQGTGVDGLLGMNVLRHFQFEIDQDNGVLYLQQR